LTASVGAPTNVPHDSKVNDAEDGYFGIRHGLQYIPNLPFAITDDTRLATLALCS
jgi:hypothetical protein